MPCTRNSLIRILLASTVCLLASLMFPQAAMATQMPATNEYINSIGMKFVRVEPGTFQMGQLSRIEWPVLPEIEGGLVILQDRMALWGRVPRLVRADVRSDLITMGRNPSYDRYIAE